MRNSLLERGPEVHEPAEQDPGVLLRAFFRRAEPEVDFDIDEPTVKAALDSEVDEEVGITRREGREAFRGWGRWRDELDDVFPPCVPLKYEGAEYLCTIDVGRADPARRRTRDAVVGEAAG